MGPFYKYKRGDLVFKNGKEAVISDYAGIVNGEPHYRVVYSDPSIPIEMAGENSLIWGSAHETLDDQWDLFKTSSKQFEPKCECGAAYTSFPNSHMSWCPSAKRGTA